jgi:hypothetical protein
MESHARRRGHLPLVGAASDGQSAGSAARRLLFVFVAPKRCLLSQQIEMSHPPICGRAAPPGSHVGPPLSTRASLGRTPILVAIPSLPSSVVQQHGDPVFRFGSTMATGHERTDTLRPRCRRRGNGGSVVNKRWNQAGRRCRKRSGAFTDGPPMRQLVHGNGSGQRGYVPLPCARAEAERAAMSGDGEALPEDQGRSAFADQGIKEKR